MEVKVDFYSCQACVSYKGKELRLGDSSTKSEDKKNIYSLLKPVSNIRRYDILTSYMRNQNLLREEREREREFLRQLYHSVLGRKKKRKCQRRRLPRSMEETDHSKVRDYNLSGTRLSELAFY